MQRSSRYMRKFTCRSNKTHTWHLNRLLWFSEATLFIKYCQPWHLCDVCPFSQVKIGGKHGHLFRMFASFFLFLLVQPNNSGNIQFLDLIIYPLMPHHSLEPRWSFSWCCWSQFGNGVSPRILRLAPAGHKIRAWRSSPLTCLVETQPCPLHLVCSRMDRQSSKSKLTALFSLRIAQWHITSEPLSLMLYIHVFILSICHLSLISCLN